MIGAFVVYVVKKLNIAFYNCFQNILGTKGYTSLDMNYGYSPNFSQLQVSLDNVLIFTAAILRLLRPSVCCCDSLCVRYCEGRGRAEWDHNGSFYSLPSLLLLRITRGRHTHIIHTNIVSS